MIYERMEIETRKAEGKVKQEKQERNWNNNNIV